MYDFMIFHKLMSGERAVSTCMGRSMEPVYFDGEIIFIYPFTEHRPDPVVGDVVHFFTGRYGFNRHQVADIFTDSTDEVWYRLVMGDGSHDQFVTRGHIIGYVVPKRMEDLHTEPRNGYKTPLRS